MKRVLIDCRLSRTASGIGRYTRELVTELLKTAEMHFMLLVRSRHEEWLKNAAEGFSYDRGSGYPTTRSGNSWMLPWMLRSERVDLLFLPHLQRFALLPCPLCRDDP